MPSKKMYLKPVLKGNFRCFLSTAGGYGMVGVEAGKHFMQVVSGIITYTKIALVAA